MRNCFDWTAYWNGNIFYCGRRFDLTICYITTPTIFQMQSSILSRCWDGKFFYISSRMETLWPYFYHLYSNTQFLISKLAKAKNFLKISSNGNRNRSSMAEHTIWVNGCVKLWKAKKTILWWLNVLNLHGKYFLKRCENHSYHPIWIADTIAGRWHRFQKK